MRIKSTDFKNIESKCFYFKIVESKLKILKNKRTKITFNFNKDIMLLLLNY